MAHSLTTIGRHLECAIETELIVELELVLIERKQSRRFRHNSIIMAERYERFCVGLHHSNPNSFGANVQLRQIF